MIAEITVITGKGVFAGTNVVNCMKTKIFDTTIRDGSYAVDFKFTCTDVAAIVRKLSKLGIEYVEVGHGMGLDASSPERGVSLYSDMDYIDAAVSVANDCKIGVFCIPGIAKIDHLSEAKKHGISFVRIGTPVHEYQKAKEYIVKSKEIGLTVMVNFMKSYAASPNELAQAASAVHELGADYVYIVDSAGCMLPEDIERYYEAVSSKSPGIRLGFHGHNNMGMAVCNSIKCVELGFDFVDCSFQGLGRSIGNTPTEMLVMALKRKYGDQFLPMDVPCLLEYGYVVLKGITDKELYSPLDLICGYTGFHSSFLKYIYKCCSEVEVDPLRLIIAYTKINKESMDYEQLKLVARELPKDNIDDHPYNFRKFFSCNYDF